MREIVASRVGTGERIRFALIRPNVEYNEKKKKMIGRFLFYLIFVAGGSG